MGTSYSLSTWALSNYSFNCYFYFHVSYYDIGVPCNLPPPCQGNRASLLAAFLKDLKVSQDLGFTITSFRVHFFLGGGGGGKEILSENLEVDPK